MFGIENLKFPIQSVAQDYADNFGTGNIWYPHILQFEPIDF